MFPQVSNFSASFRRAAVTCCGVDVTSVDVIYSDEWNRSKPTLTKTMVLPYGGALTRKTE